MPADCLNKKHLTINDIAMLAGVSKAAVSGVINNKSRVGEEKEKRILKIIKKYNFTPNDSARALSLNRTYQIGYLVSSKVTLGLANSTFATYLAGISESCQKLGYRVMASAHDMTKVENFLLVKKLRQHCVDGLILTGVYEQRIIEKLRRLNIPMIFIGGPREENILCLRKDMHNTYLKMLRYLTANSHHKIFFACNQKEVIQSFKNSVRQFKLEYSNPDKLDFLYGKDEAIPNQFEFGKILALQWLKTKPADRCTAFISNDQACCGFLSKIIQCGVKCPDEISIFCGFDSYLCQENAIPISAPKTDIFEDGQMVSGLMIDMLENNKSYDDVKKLLADKYHPCDLIIRATTGQSPR